MELTTADKDLFARLLQHCLQQRAYDSGPDDYLQSQGIDPATVLDPYRLGIGTAKLPASFTTTEDAKRLQELGLAHRRGGPCLLSGTGVAIPTFDPREPEQPVGFIRQHVAQNKYRFLTPPRGVACTAVVGAAPQVIITDAPLVALRLASFGAPGVILALDPVVLPPLYDWLAGREILLIAQKAPRLAALHLALGTLPHRRRLLSCHMLSSRETIWHELGIDPAVVPEEEPPTPIDELLLHHLHQYACGRLAAGEGQDVLRVAEAEQPAAITAYQIGYLPADYQHALQREQRRSLEGLRLGSTLVLPATDTDGLIVDLWAVHPEDTGCSAGGCFQELRGMLGAGVVTASRELIITDTFLWLMRLHRQGYCNVFLLRGLADAELNAERLAASGIQRATLRCRVGADAIAAVLQGVGLSVSIQRGLVAGPERQREVHQSPASAEKQALAAMKEVTSDSDAEEDEKEGRADEAETLPNPTELPPLELIAFDTVHEVAIFQAGPVRYAIQLGDPEQPQRQVTIRRGEATHQDRFALNVRAQCERFAASASRRVELPPIQIRGHLFEAWQQVKEHEVQADELPVVVVEENEKQEAEQLLRSPNLLCNLLADLATLGWAGEDQAKGLLYLTTVSRLLPRPLWSVYRATAGGAPWQSLGMITALLPPEACIVFHRLTESMLRQTDARSLRHKLLLIDRAETLRPEGAIALRALREWGSVGWQQVLSSRTETQQGRTAGLTGEVKGPVAALAAAAGELDRRCRDCFLQITVDDSPEQTERVLAAQRSQHGQASIGADEARAIVERHHAVQRLLRPSAVIIPYAERIDFPMTAIRHRDEHDAFLTLIQSSALLHQFQRSRTADGAIIASEDDFQHARNLSAGFLGAVGDGLSSQGRQLLQRLFATATTSFTLAELAGLLPDWTYYAYRATAEELVHMGHCSAAGGGQGRKRIYQLAAAGTQTCGPALRPATDTTADLETLRPFETFWHPSKGVTRFSNAV